MAEPVAVLHSTESDDFDATVDFLAGLPGIQPHTLYDPETNQEHTFIAWPKAAKALKNLPGGVETNNRPGGAFQVEILGYAAQADDHSPQWYANLGAYLRKKAKQVGFALKVTYSWVPSPFPKGLDPRLTGIEWYGLTGIIGHQRIPEQNHTDPGDLRKLNPHLIEPTKETPMHPMLQLGLAYESIHQLYLVHRAQPPSTDEAQAWRTELANRARKGEDLAATIAFVDWKLGQE